MKQISNVRKAFASKGDDVTLTRLSTHKHSALKRIQRLKSRIEILAIELFPPDRYVVNVANLRHIWIVPNPPAFMWGQR
jgi:hypothetical protein